MISKIEEIDFTKKIKKEKLLVVLKKEAADISIINIMKASTFLSEDAKYVQASYRKEYIKSYTEAFIIRLKDLRDNKENYDEHVNPDELKDAIELLKEQEAQVQEGKGFDSHFFKIYKIMSIYTTFVLEEPVHPPGTPFPGGFKVKYECGIYLCPVKESQKNNPGAVCGFCIAEQDEDML